MLRLMLRCRCCDPGWALLHYGGLALRVLAAAAANAFVFLMFFVMKHGCIAEHAMVL